MDRWERGAFVFTNKRLNAELSDLMERLSALMRKVSQDTVPEKIGGKFKTGYKPFRIVPQEEYDRRSEESKKANAIASQAWVLLDRLVVQIKDRIPEALDNPVN